MAANIYKTETEIQEAITRLGQQLKEKLNGSQLPVFVGVLNSSVIFYADIIRQIPGDLECDFIDVSKNSATINVSHLKKLEGRDVVVIQDQVNTGKKLEMVINALNQLNPNKIITVTLLKQQSSKTPVDLFGFTLKGESVHGYGIDKNGYFRQSPCLMFD